MANDEHVALLKQGVEAWSRETAWWRKEDRNIRPDLSGADLAGADLHYVNLSGADLSGADLSEANLTAANLTAADLNRTKLRGAKLSTAKLIGANLSRADLDGANLINAILTRANLTGARLARADLNGAYLLGAKLTGASLEQALLYAANLAEADLSGADLSAAILVRADLEGADLTGCRVFGISAWRLNLERTKQKDLIITNLYEPAVTVDDIEVAQFVYLLLHNEKIRNVIDTIGKKGVLLLGRFTEGRLQILERLREKLRNLGYVPMVFNFDKPETKDFTETVRLLANLSHFVIVDITNPRSAPLELQATVPDYMVPFVPILYRFHIGLNRRVLW
jgi:uncharacterized protein YjbI with pentapeptide repeats